MGPMNAGQELNNPTLVSPADAGNEERRALEDAMPNNTSASDIEMQRVSEKITADALTWDGPDDPDDPRNWGRSKVMAHIILIAMLQLISNLASTMFAPASQLVMEEFDFSSRAVASLSVSIYILGFAIGPLFWAPLSEVYGRLPIYVTSTIMFFAFVLGSTLSVNLGMFMAFRLLSGCGGAAPLTCSGGTLADLIPKNKRGRYMAIMSIGPLMGPTVGPIMGGFIGEYVQWRWIFWLLAIMVGGLVPLAAFALRETYGPAILRRRENRRRKAQGRPPLHTDKAAITMKLKRSILRPLNLLFLSPIVLSLSLYAAFCFGLLFLLFTTFSTVFKSQYGFSMSISGLAYIGIGIGTLGGLIVQGQFSDKMMYQRAAKRGRDAIPEDRMPPMAYMCWTIPVGMFWYGWSVSAKAHWIVPIIGTSFVGLGFIFIMNPSMTYLVDCFGSEAAASALAAFTILRCIAGAFLPLAGPSMYGSLGYGWGNSLLGFLGMAMIPIPFYLLRYGEKLRLKQQLVL